jgi:TatD DNase family protein
VLLTVLVDSHCHLNMLELEALGGDLTQVMAAASEQGVGHMLCVSVDIETFPQVLALAREHANVSASVGLHPNNRGVHEPSVEELVLLAQDPRVVAIGETGLDYYRSPRDQDSGVVEWQHERFRCHIAAARAARKPLIVHSRDARADTLHILREEHADEVGGVMHCFTEGWDTARAAMDLNFHISFSGIVTFKNAVALKDVAKRVPLDRLLVETDSPYLAPVPFRGKTNQPAYVRHVAEHIAELRGQPFDVIADATSRNYFGLFPVSA